MMNLKGVGQMFETIYQKLIIIGFTDKMILLTILTVCYLLLYLIMRRVIFVLIKYRCYNLLSYLTAFLIIFLITKDQIIQTNHLIYMYLLCLIGSYLTIQLLFKKIIRKQT